MKSSLTATLTSFAVAGLVACGDQAGKLPVAPTNSVAFNAFENSEWSVPIHLDAPINSPARELSAELSPDGLSIYFGSDRPGSIGGTMDIWAARRECLECPWGTPVNLNINSPKTDGEPTFSPDGLLLFFSSDRDGGHGGGDVWLARRNDKDDDLGWETPINLGSGVNTTQHETGPAYVPALHAEGTNLYFVRGVALAAFDIYRARVTRDGETPEPAIPVAELNHPSELDADPTISHDGKEIFFWSQRPGGLGLVDIWVATRQSARDRWSTPENMGTAINTAGPDLTPGLSRDGRTLLWSAGFKARGGLGLTDIWMSTRTPAGR